MSLQYVDNSLLSWRKPQCSRFTVTTLCLDGLQPCAAVWLAAGAACSMRTHWLSLQAQNRNSAQLNEVFVQNPHFSFNMWKVLVDRSWWSLMKEVLRRCRVKSNSSALTFILCSEGGSQVCGWQQRCCGQKAEREESDRGQKWLSDGGGWRRSWDQSRPSGRSRRQMTDGNLRGGRAGGPASGWGRARVLRSSQEFTAKIFMLTSGSFLSRL